jgi:MFS-type transporter involved in bile tolerance (Atg22 family)
MSGLFLGTALLSLTMLNSDTSSNDDDDVPITFLGVPMKSSSLLAFMGTLGGFVGALFMPLLGAIVDHTPHRRLVAVATGVFLVTINAVQAVVSVDTGWRHIAFLQIIAGWCYAVHATAKYSYLPEMEDEVTNVAPGGYGNVAVNEDSSSHDDSPERPPSTRTSSPNDNGDSSVISRVTSINTGVSMLTQFLFLVLCIVLSSFLAPSTPEDPTLLQKAAVDVSTARISQIATAVISVVLYTYSWWKLPARPALHPLPPNSSLLTAGFKKLHSTFKELKTTHPSLAVYLFVTSLSEAAANAFTTIAVTYTKVVIHMSAVEAGILFAVVLLFGYPGASLSDKYITNKVGPFRSYLLSLLAWTVVTSVSTLFLSGPSSKPAVFVFGALWGGLMGWYYPTNATVFVEFIPRGQESEMMGLFIFVGQVLVWMPPLFFGVLNEAGVSMRWGLVLDAAFFAAAGLVCHFGIGVKKYDHLKLGKKNMSIEIEMTTNNAAEFTIDEDSDFV